MITVPRDFTQTNGYAKHGSPQRSRSFHPMRNGTGIYTQKARKKHVPSEHLLRTPPLGEPCPAVPNKLKQSEILLDGRRSRTTSWAPKPYSRPADTRHYNSRGELLAHAEPPPRRSMHVQPRLKPALLPGQQHPSDPQRPIQLPTMHIPHQSNLVGSTKESPIVVTETQFPVTLSQEAATVAAEIKPIGHKPPAIYASNSHALEHLARETSDNELLKLGDVMQCEKPCSTLLCRGFALSESSSRCLRCIRRRWDGRSTSKPPLVIRVPSALQRQRLTTPRVGGSRRVSWADGWNSTDDEAETLFDPGALEQGPSGSSYTTPTTAVCRWDSDVSTLTPSEDDDDMTSSSESDTDASSDDLLDHPLLIRIPPLLKPSIHIPARKKVPAPAPNPTQYPVFQNLKELTLSLYVQLFGFLEAQTMHTLSKPHARPQTVLKFAGAVSFVTADLDICSSLERTQGVGDLIERVHNQIEHVSKLHFDASSQSTSKDAPLTDQSVVMIPSRSGPGLAKRYKCRHAAEVFSPVPVTSRDNAKGRDQLPCKVVHSRKWMDGELEIAVVPDASHMIYPGQQLVVRFRLEG